MNYIYDILVNFQKKYYDFYEWNQDDKITHLRKAPIFKISNNDLNIIKNQRIKFDNTFLKSIYNKTENFKENNINKLKYVCLITSNQETIAIKLNKEGYINEKSSLAIDENEDAIEAMHFQKEIKINYQIINKETQYNFKTRFELENEKFITDELIKIYNQRNYQKLSYICLECFGKPESNINKAFDKIQNEIKKTNENYHKIFDFFKMTSPK
jgi:hypothetical protein